MRNWSIRTRIILGVLLVNLMGMFVVMVYLHESYSGGLDVTEQKSATLGVSAWNTLIEVSGPEMGSIEDRTSAQRYLDSLKTITGAEYGLLMSKDVLDEAAYASELETAGVPNNWDERENYVLTAITEPTLSDEMQLQTSPDAIPEIGRIVGVENGACSLMCHGEVGGEGDFWAVRWSKDHHSRGHVVFPVTNAEGKPVGVIYSIEDISAQADSARAAMVNTALVIIVGLVAATVLIAFMLNSLVFRRLDRMVAKIEEISIRVAGGDYTAHFEPDTARDEIGQFEQFFARFMDLVANTLRSLTK